MSSILFFSAFSFRYSFPLAFSVLNRLISVLGDLTKQQQNTEILKKQTMGREAEYDRLRKELEDLKKVTTTNYFSRTHKWCQDAGGLIEYPYLL